MPSQELGMEPQPPTIVNSTELRAINLGVSPFLSTVGPRPVRQTTRVQPKRSGRRAAVVLQAVPSVTELPADTVYELHADEDARIRCECW